MRKIAIIQLNKRSFYDNDYESITKMIATTISDWSEVSDEDYNILTTSHLNKDFIVIERPTNESEVIKKSVAEYVEWIKKEEARRKKAEIDNKIKSEAAKAKREKKQFERLKKKFEKAKAKQESQ